LQKFKPQTQFDIIVSNPPFFIKTKLRIEGRLQGIPTLFPLKN